ncbi:hypothetical protein [Alistipes sp.]|uniref:hypothetical protein n=1 Tax=Alistipes sp. TaxID=1872444 RepID=UPI0013290570|nr:hypothetical protein [Alistipes sp.]MUU02067.1 hypothetical protein [Alistipes sp.]
MKSPTEKSGKYQLRYIKKCAAANNVSPFQVRQCAIRGALTPNGSAHTLSRMLHAEPFNHLEPINYVVCTTKIRILFEMKKLRIT